MSLNVDPADRKSYAVAKAAQLKEGRGWLRTQTDFTPAEIAAVTGLGFCDCENPLGSRVCYGCGKVAKGGPLWARNKP